MVLFLPALVLIFVRNFIAVEAVEANGEMEWGRDLVCKQLEPPLFLRMTHAHQDGGRGRGAQEGVSARTMIDTLVPATTPHHAQEGGRMGGGHMIIALVDNERTT